MRDKLVPRRRLIVQVALASALAWQGAVWLFDDPRPFFAPIAAVIALNATGRRQVRQTVELVVGVAVGIGIADLLARVIGTGAIQIGVVVAAALIAATAIDGGPLLFGQAASSGILVVALAVPGGASLAPTRLFDALLGGGCALLISIVILPHDADGEVSRAARRILDGIAEVVDGIAAALRAGDIEAARRCMVSARALDQRLVRFRETTATGSEIVMLAPLRRYARDAVARFAGAEVHVTALTADTRVLARLVVQLLRIGAPLAPSVPAAISDLAEAVRALAAELETDAGVAPEESVAAARRAVRLARSDDPGSSGDLIAREIRSFALHVLYAGGLEERAANSALQPEALT
jgi:Fusaric acid resistance protein-like